MRDTSEFKQRFDTYKKEGIKAVYEAGKILPEVVVTADDPIKKLVEDVNARSNADFVNRAKDPNRTWIQDWENKNKIATHKLSWAEGNGKVIVYPEVQNINGKLHDFTDPKYNHGKWDALDSAIERGDTLQMTPEQAKMYTENYKKYYPKGKTFDCGKSLPKYDTGWWDDLKDKIPGYAIKAAQFVAPTAFNTIATIVGKTSEAFHDRNRLLRAAHSSSRGGDSNVESFLFDSNPKDELFYTGSFKLPLNQKGEVFKPDILSSERSTHAPYKERDLVKYAITGDKGSLQDSDPITVNDSTYNRVIDGVIFPYSGITFPDKLQNVVDSIANSPKPIMSFGPNTNYGDGDGTFQYIDNVANHSGVIKKVNNGFEFVPFDNWDFKGDYKYTGNLPIKINNIFESLIQPNEEYPDAGSFMIKQKGVPIKFDKYGDINFLNWYSTLKGGADTNSATQSMINAIKEIKGYDKGKSIHIKPANRGKFNATKKRTGKTTEQLAHSKNPLTRKRAIFALNSRKFKH